VRPHVAALGSGLLFGVGLGVSGMASPAKVIGFLDITGAWDASLAFVMVGAIGVHALLRLLVHRRAKPLYAQTFDLPRYTEIDRRIVIGSAVFGVGWGLAGYCPGPALVSAATGPTALVFIVAMAVGMAAHRALVRTGEPVPAE
jgi:uncharacterized membrane protein YedE/YeeE